MRVGSFGLVLDGLRRVLMVQHPNGKWGFPGGRVDFKELVNKTAVREIREETGLWVRAGKLLGVFSHRKRPGVMFLFDALYLRGKLRPQAEEIKDCRFFSWAEIVRMRKEFYPAQISALYQVLFTEPEIPGQPIFNHFIRVPAKVPKRVRKKAT